MVKIKFQLSKPEIEMLYYCIESALDLKHMENEQDKKKAKEILKQLSKYL
jgi:hypothetical protein